MANKEKWGIDWLQVILDGSGDWITSKAVKFKSLKFLSLNLNDLLVIRQVVPNKIEEEWPEFTLPSNAPYAVGCFFIGVHYTKMKIPYNLCTFKEPLKVKILFEFL